MIKAEYVSKLKSFCHFFLLNLWFGVEAIKLQISLRFFLINASIAFGSIFFISNLSCKGIEFLSSFRKTSIFFTYLYVGMFLFLCVGIILNPLSFFMIIPKKGLL